MSEFLMLTACDPVYQPLAGISEPDKRAYCERHGYRFVAYRDRPATYYPGFRHPSWDKIHWLREHLDEADWLFWTDTDALVTAPEIPLTRYVRDDADLLIRREIIPFDHAPSVGGTDQAIPAIMAGHMLIRGRCKWSHRFLSAVWDYPRFAWEGVWEMAAMSCLWRLEPWVAERVRVHDEPGWTESLVTRKEWKAGHFIAHFAGLGSAENRVRLMKMMTAILDRLTLPSLPSLS